jgi:hypothetical protein
MELTNREIIGLYLLLTENTEKLDIVMMKLENKLGKYLYDKISIHELEKLQYFYKQGIDVLE